MRTTARAKSLRKWSVAAQQLTFSSPSRVAAACVSRWRRIDCNIMRRTMRRRRAGWCLPCSRPSPHVAGRRHVVTNCLLTDDGLATSPSAPPARPTDRFLDVVVVSPLPDICPLLLPDICCHRTPGHPKITSDVCPQLGLGFRLRG